MKESCQVLGEGIPNLFLGGDRKPQPSHASNLDVVEVSAARDECTERSIFQQLSISRQADRSGSLQVEYPVRLGGLSFGGLEGFLLPRQPEKNRHYEQGRAENERGQGNETAAVPS